MKAQFRYVLRNLEIRVKLIVGYRASTLSAVKSIFPQYRTELEDFYINSRIDISFNCYLKREYTSYSPHTLTTHTEFISDVDYLQLVCTIEGPKLKETEIPELEKKLTTDLENWCFYDMTRTNIPHLDASIDVRHVEFFEAYIVER